MPTTLRATELRCENLVEPLGIDPDRPTFGWVPVAAGPTPQRAYRLLVAGSPELLGRGEGDVWDSGRVESSAVNGVRYAGPPLRPRQRYWWTARLWSDEGEGPAGEVASFETGIGDGEWRGHWIGGEAGVSSPLLRAELSVAGEVTRARAYVCALGYYELRLNGEKVGDRVLEPAQTSYDHDPELLDGTGQSARIANPRTLYTTYDVTAQLRAGENAVGLILGNGWYSAEQDIGPGPLPRKPWGDRPRALVEIVVETEAGETILVSDEEWRTSAGPILYNDYAHGERFDARRLPLGWDAPGFEDGVWASAATFEPPAGRPRAQLLEPIRVIESLPPVSRVEGPEGGEIVDFGQHVSGWTRIAVSGPAGTEVTLRHAGELGADGGLDDDANMNAWLPARQTDTYVLGGGGVEEWEPRFTLHGFRYLEVKASDPEVEVERLAARVVHSDLRSIGEFSCSDPLLEQIHRNVQWTHRASFQGFPQDAAERNERVGWVGDPGWAIEDYLFNFDATAFWLKWLDDLADAQIDDGAFPVICPIMWRGGLDMAARAEEEESGDVDVGAVPEDFDTMIYWPYAQTVDFSGTSFPMIAWTLYQHTGDRSILERHYAAMRRGVEYVRSQAVDGIIDGVGLGDHMEPQPDGTSDVFPHRTPVELTSTAWLYRLLSILAEAAAVLGEDDDAARYAELAAEIRAAFNDRFYDRERATYATGSQTALAMPLWFGIVEDDERERVVATLVERIGEQDGHLETGTMGTAALQNVLGPAGRAGAMLGIATQTTYPGWGHQVEAGATTVWETWGGDATYSRNMKLMASIEVFLYRDVAGLAPASPGWERILVRPRLTDRLARASAAVETVRGRAAVSWRAENGALQLEVEVPASSTAEVWLPRPGGETEVVELGAGVHRLEA